MHSQRKIFSSQHSISLTGREVSYQLLQSTRRRTFAVEIYPDLQIIVRTPVGEPIAKIEKQLHAYACWINKKLDYFQHHSPQPPTPYTYSHGEKHSYLGNAYSLHLQRQLIPSVILHRRRLYISNQNITSAEVVASLLKQWYLQQAKREFSTSLDRCLALFTHHGIIISRPKVTIKWMRSRWGSFSSIAGKNRMNLNAHLIKMPARCIDSVVVHELCHFKYRRHGLRFYGLMDKIMPDWRVQDKKLRQELLDQASL